MRLKAWGMRRGSFVPEGHPAFQRRGGQSRDPRPEGTTENTRCPQPSLRDGPLFRFADPALKRQAIVGSPSGAKRRRELTDGFSRTSSGRALTKIKNNENKDNY